ncbi:MAG: FAD-binding protein [Candidatus Margulisiibacteriota bacterium]
MTITNWGLYPRLKAEIHDLKGVGPALAWMQSRPAVIARGLGRCYGDSSLATAIVSTQTWQRFLAFDVEAGVLTAESGTSLADILEVIVPKGWFLPVTPGTKFVSLGGAVASDIHGKNHHQDGSFGHHVLTFDLLLASGDRLVCSRTENPEVFWATLGGMGLTGLVLTVTLQLKKIESATIVQTTLKAPNLEAVMDAFETNQSAPYSVAWIDCLASGDAQGRSVLMCGRHALAQEVGQNPLAIRSKRTLTVPFSFPSGVLNRFSVKAFNALYYAKAKSQVHSVDFDTFFYPLDAIHHWNRIYGKNGFTQYQFVLPMAASKAGLKAILTRINRAQLGSFLAVLKPFGAFQNPYLSFPMPGYTLALDFPLSEPVLALLDELDDLVRDFGGRLYLSKDVRMKPDMLVAGYPELSAFLAIKQRVDPDGVFQSLQSKRLGLTP